MALLRYIAITPIIIKEPRLLGVPEDETFVLEDAFSFGDKPPCEPRIPRNVSPKSCLPSYCIL